jgi:hypothetical protein
MRQMLVFRRQPEASRLIRSGELNPIAGRLVRIFLRCRDTGGSVFGCVAIIFYPYALWLPLIRAGVTTIFAKR